MIGLIFVAPFLLILVIFALSNMEAVPLAFWPTDLQLVVPLSVAVLAIGGLFFILGAIVTWTGAIAARTRARRAERQVRALQDEVASLRRTAPAPMPGSAASPLTSPGTGLRTIPG